MIWQLFFTWCTTCNVCFEINYVCVNCIIIYNLYSKTLGHCFTYIHIYSVLNMTYCHLSLRGFILNSLKILRCSIYSLNFFENHLVSCSQFSLCLLVWHMTAITSLFCKCPNDETGHWFRLITKHLHLLLHNPQAISVSVHSPQLCTVTWQGHYWPGIYCLSSSLVWSGWCMVHLAMKALIWIYADDNYKSKIAV